MQAPKKPPRRANGSPQDAPPRRPSELPLTRELQAPGENAADTLLASCPTPPSGQARASANVDILGTGPGRRSVSSWASSLYGIGLAPTTAAAPAMPWRSPSAGRWAAPRASPVTLVLGRRGAVAAPGAATAPPTAADRGRTACSRSVTLALAAGMLGLSSKPAPGAHGVPRSAAPSEPTAASLGPCPSTASPTPLVQERSALTILESSSSCLVGVILLTGASTARTAHQRRPGNGPEWTPTPDRSKPRARARRGRAKAPERDLLSARPSPSPRELIVRATHVEAPSRALR